MEETEKTKPKLPSQEIDYIKLAKILLSRWYWVVGSVVICMVAANIYLWYTPKIYATSATLKFEEKKSEISDLISLPGNNDRTNISKIQSETIVLQSSALLLNAIKRFDYRFSFYIVGRVLNRTSELYPQKPLDVELVKFDSLNFYHDLITYRPLDRSRFSITYNSGGKQIKNTCYYDKPFTIGPTAFSISYPGVMPKTALFLFKINAAEDLVGRVRNGLHVAETARNSNIISLQETDSNPQFAADVLNAIMKEYLVYDRNQRTQSASQMIKFIDNQLDFLSNEVKGSESSISQYQNKKKIMDVSSTSSRALNKVTELESQSSILKIDLLSVDQLKKEVLKSDDNELPNFNTGGTEHQQLNDAISALNLLIRNKKVALKTYTANSQTIQDINQQILQAKNSILGSINAMHDLIVNKLSYIQNQIGPINQQIAELPSAERDMVALKRDFEINDKVYSFLSEKKLDAQINTAGILPGATIIDEAKPNYSPVSPNDQQVQRSSEILGLAIGLGLIILIRVINPYIYDKETIESLTAIPIIGVIRKFPEPIDEYSSQILAISKPKSIFAESVRSVRTNLSFLASEKKSKVICITSEVAGEGKSFVAVNLSSTLSLIDKKVILVGADLRRSKLHKTFRVPNDIGLSNYLANQCTADDIISHSGQPNLDFIVSGPVPPNPSELLHSKRMSELIADLNSRYDVVMIDTAPIGLVSDAVPLIRSSDINLFVIRSGKSKFYAATVPQRIAQEYHLDNTVIVLNAFAQDLLHSRYYTTKFTGENYGGGKYYYYSDYTGYESSGYYVDKNEDKWWDIRRWFKR
ncbi:tyrosine-protein kinase family protein [Mucilaginibacter sp. L3T2-6]|uniref:GumC family protein n=1 Tax=Mucilaginibacter sp. L3T2-6 TaxID=3062491 RepID=UPI0026768382|nr:tyrosine-protein kinase family protein [Mucilaginibacter sp. L3T2-6]MDO3643045.1 polysaccharide biosynthesis tyrosine autokinase [Mucilaginibacter sp. L3T2-6]MDV6215812.1 polysaccharide biosynthesis tyrosine autokinase [Mucilaginibacter sp. L3T2-6]